MTATTDLLTSEHADDEIHDVLHRAPRVLLGVSDAAAQALETLGISTVFDLANSRIFADAKVLLEAGADPGSLVARFGAVPGDIVTTASADVPVDQLRFRPVGILAGIGPANQAAVQQALDVATVRDLALWPPYVAARELLRRAFFPDTVPDGDLDAPADLLPKSGDYPTERIFYRTLVLDELREDPGQPLTPLESAEPIDVAPVATADFGFRRPGVGALLTFAQSWFTQGVGLGQLLHSVALAPGESTRIAMLDWSRRTSTSATETISETEALSNAMRHSRAMSEVQNAVAREAQSGFSRTHSESAASQSGGSGGFGLGPFTFGGSESTASNTTDATSFSTSSGRRDLEASMSQNVMDSTQQNANAVRNRRATIVREVSQAEHEDASTRLVANYNHMHALSVQYYEVIQIYRVTVQLTQVDRCLFIPLKLIDFTNLDLVAKFRLALADAALNDRVRRMLTTEYGVVQVQPNGIGLAAGTITDPRPSPAPVAEVVTAGTTAGSATDAGAPSAADAASSSTRRPAEAPTSAGGVAARAGWDLNQIGYGSDVLKRPLLHVNDNNVYLPEHVTLVGVSLRNAEASQFAVERRSGEQVALTNVSASGAALETPTELIDLASILVAKSMQLAATATLQLSLDSLGQRFPLDLPIYLVSGSGGLQRVVTFSGERAGTELVDHLMANRLHYSQAVFRALDSASLALLLSPYTFGGRPVAELIDPLPVTVAGNYLVFRMHEEATDRNNQPTPWGQWLAQHGIDLKTVKQDLIPLPSGGVFAEAVLGRYNSAEKLDITRFWNWQDSPIPLSPPDIAAVQLTSRAEPEDLKPGTLGQPLINIVNPASLPEPAGLGAIIAALASGNMFRDMSGLSATAALAQAGLQAASQGATEAGAQAGAAMTVAAQKEVETLRIAASLIGAMMGAPGAGGASQPISGEGAKINHGRSLDERGVGRGQSIGGRRGTSGLSGAGGGTSTVQPSTGGTGTSSADGVGNGRGISSSESGEGALPIGSSQNGEVSTDGDSRASSYEGQAYEHAVWGPAGTSAEDLFQTALFEGDSGTVTTASASSSRPPLTEYDSAFQGTLGQQLKELVSWAANEVDLNSGLVAVNAAVEVDRPKEVYLRAGPVSSFEIGVDDYYDKRVDIARKVPAHSNVRWDPSRVEVNINEQGREVRTVWFATGRDALLASAVYLKHGEVVLSTAATNSGNDTSLLPVLVRYMLIRLAFNAGHAAALKYLQSALAGENILVWGPRRTGPRWSATLHAAQALHVSEAIFGVDPR
jgi:hypothetical protein